jgi:hypothetical protein
MTNLAGLISNTFALLRVHRTLYKHLGLCYNTDADQRDVGIVSAHTQIALHFCSRWITIQRSETLWKPPGCGPAGANCKASFLPR